jgi:hypothetical protein
MTAQIMDKIRIDDQDWALCEWIGENVVPSSESLGFATEMESTANYSGRVDHFVVDEGRLRLSHVDAHLAEASRDFVPKDGGREDIKRTYWAHLVTDVTDLLRGGGGKIKRELSTSTRVVLYFEELWVPFTGRVIGGRALDWDKYQHMGTQAASSFRSRLVLELEQGKLLSKHVVTTDITSDENDDASFDEATVSD